MKILEILLTAFFAILIVIFKLLVNSFVAFQLYNWFIFDYLKIPISWVEFSGITMFLEAIMPYSVTHLKDEYEDKSSKFISFFLQPILLLVFGYIFKHFIL